MPLSKGTWCIWCYPSSQVHHFVPSTFQVGEEPIMTSITVHSTFFQELQRSRSDVDLDEGIGEVYADGDKLSKVNQQQAGKWSRHSQHCIFQTLQLCNILKKLSDSSPSPLLFHRCIFCTGTGICTALQQWCLDEHQYNNTLYVENSYIMELAFNPGTQAWPLLPVTKLELQELS